MNTKTSKSFGWGFSTPWTMVNVAVVGLAMLSSGPLGLTTMRKVATLASYPTLNQKGQAASGLIAGDIRRSSSIGSVSADSIVLKTGVNSTVSYVFDSKARTLTRKDAQGTQTILTDLDSFSFSLFQQPAANAAYAKFLPASAKDARMVGCRWSSSRKIAGTKVDSEAVEMAPVVLRNRCV
jgi:hypothetical protein